MKMIANKNALALALSLTVLAGCSSTDTQPTDDMAGMEQDTSSEVSAVDNSNGVSATELSDAEKAEMERQAKNKEEAALREIRTFYFEFDKSDIKAESRLPLMAHAKFLAANPNVKIVLEGHCDERGTKEYNMALGERRAKAVERFLVVNGASRDQLDVLSLGEERPEDFGHDEAAWAKNRRAVVSYK